MTWSARHIFDILIFQISFCCCRFMCFSNTSLKLVPAQQCHTLFVSVLSPSLASSLSADRRANLKNPLHREVQSWCHYRFIVHDTATPKTSSGQMCTEARALVETAGFLLTGQIYAARSVRELLCGPQVQHHPMKGGELSPLTCDCELHHHSKLTALQK